MLREGGYCRVRSNLSDSMVNLFRDKEITRLSYRHTCRLVKPGTETHAISKTWDSRMTSESGNHCVRSDLADGLVKRVGNINHPIGTNGHSFRTVKAGVAPCPVGDPRFTGLTRKGRGDSLRGNFPDDVAGNLDDVNIAGCVDRQAVGVIKFRGVTRTIDGVCIVAPTGDGANSVRFEYGSPGGQGGGGENQDKDWKEQSFHSRAPI